MASPPPFADLHLAMRLEPSEAHSNAAFVEMRARIDPSGSTEWRDFDGIYAMFDGAGSPITQTFGLGLFGEINDSVLKRPFSGIEARRSFTRFARCPERPWPSGYARAAIGPLS